MGEHYAEDVGVACSIHATPIERLHLEYLIVFQMRLRVFSYGFVKDENDLRH